MNLLEAQTISTSPIIVVGMHRSGTSLLARLLTTMGVHMGALVDMNHEALSFKHANIALLRRTGANWATPSRFLKSYPKISDIDGWTTEAWRLLQENSDQYGTWNTNQIWGWKDPRTSLTLPIWLRLFPNARIIHVVRNGIAIALSLARREPRRFLMRTDVPRMFPPTIVRGYSLWDRYVRTILDYKSTLSHNAWLTLRYEDLIEEPVRYLAMITKYAQLDVSTDEFNSITSRVVSTPTRMSDFERTRVRWIIRTGLIDLTTMNDFYGPAFVSKLLASE